MNRIGNIVHHNNDNDIDNEDDDDIYLQSVIYYISIIDYLQPFHRKKEMEYYFNIIRYQNNNTYSCIPPNLYGQRLISFVDSIIT